MPIYTLIFMGYLRISSFMILINYIGGFNTNNVVSFFHNPNFRCLLLFINGILLLYLLKLFVDSTQILTFPWNKSAGPTYAFCLYYSFRLTPILVD